MRTIFTTRSTVNKEKGNRVFSSLPATALLTIFLNFLVSLPLEAQNFRFGIFADPVISWFSTDTKETRNEGARAGFNFGLTFNRYFHNNYSFSTGISIMNTGGRLYNTDTIEMVFNNFDTQILPGQSVVYRIQYVNVPVGLKFESNQIGYVTFFSDIGLDARVAIGGKVDIPSESIRGETADKEIKPLNLAYHIAAGIAYSLGGTTELVIGLGYEHAIMDVTKDRNGQPLDKVSGNILKFRFGVNF